jgi:hypothetical protein
MPTSSPTTGIHRPVAMPMPTAKPAIASTPASSSSVFAARPIV